MEIYDFASPLASCASGLRKLGGEMRQVYEQLQADKGKIAEAFFVACAQAVASDAVQRVLATLQLSTKFRITVPHPDTGREYYLK
jgi:hypothetical protein